jgi:hypothetical protein
VVVNGAMPQAEREEITRAMYELHKPLFDAIRSAPR